MLEYSQAFQKHQHSFFLTNLKLSAYQNFQYYREEQGR